MPKDTKKDFLRYKGRPMVRCGKIIYYGEMSEPYVVMLQILSTKKFQDVEIADKVLVQLMNTRPEVKLSDCIVKRAERDGLYNAIDLGSIWLDRALADEKSE